MKLVSNVLIFLIWAGGLISLFFLSNQNTALSANMMSTTSVQSDRLFQSRAAVGMASPQISFDGDSIKPELRSAEKQIRANAEGNRIEFSSKNSFLEYFENQYPVNELLAQYNAALAEAGSVAVPQKIVVEAKDAKRGTGFADRFKVKLRFDIKPVPE